MFYIIHNISIFCYDSHRRYIDLDLHKNTYVVGTLNDFKPLSRRTVTVVKGCRSHSLLQRMPALVVCLSVCLYQIKHEF